MIILLFHVKDSFRHAIRLHALQKAVVIRDRSYLYNLCFTLLFRQAKVLFPGFLQLFVLYDDLLVCRI